MMAEFKNTKDDYNNRIANIPNVVGDMYDKDIVIAFYSKSADAPYPGSGSSEKMKEGHKKEYEELHKILQWRKKLSNFWDAPFLLNGRGILSSIIIRVANSD